MWLEALARGGIMQVWDKQKGPRYQRDNIVSHLLVSELTTGSKFLTTSLVEMSPGGTQHPHAHEPEQCYFILEGEGIMTVGAERQLVSSGACIFIPSNETHGLENTGRSTLRYFSASAPSFGGVEALKELWPLNAGAE
jgi:mannose-6-phosphate isomerase-like protein (cupin superfamily)